MGPGPSGQHVPRASRGRSVRPAVLCAALGVAWLASPAGAGLGRAAFPELRPATPERAVEFLRAQSSDPHLCVTAAAVDAGLGGHPRPLVRRAETILAARAAGLDDATSRSAHGVSIRWTDDATSLDRVDPTDADGDGLPDVIQSALAGLDAAHQALVDRLGLAAPDDLDVVALHLGGVDGVLVPAFERPGGVTLLLDAGPGASPDAVRRATVHQFAHAVVSSDAPAVPVGWSEALAVWAVVDDGGIADPGVAGALRHRLDTMHLGLLADDASLAPGNALWLTFVADAYGPAALRLALEELGRGTAADAAFDLAVRRASQDDLAAALREFHIWTVLVGERADTHHFPFAARLGEPRFETSAEGLPALSVQAGPGIAPLGLAQARLRPDETDGGLRIRVEGDFAATWDGDLLLIDDGEGRVRRVPLGLAADGRGEIIVPLDGVDEAWLLVRNLGSETLAPQRVTWAAHRERGFPYELTALEALPLDDPAGGVRVRWTTVGERRLVGFDVIRSRPDGGDRAVVTPVWIPALGDPTAATSYEFIDGSARPGVEYEYRVVGITRDGLTSRSRPVSPAVTGDD